MDSPLKSPIFLLGNVRSGTSMMLELFNSHPAVTGWYEPRVVWVYAAPWRNHDVFTAEDATPRVRRYIRKRFLSYQQAHGDLRVMEKTPSNLLRIPYVETIFPESKYLYLVREPFAYLSSADLQWRGGPIRKSKLKRRIKEAPKTQLPFYAGRLIRDYWRTKVLRKPTVSVWGVRYPGIYADLKRMPVEQVIAKQWAFASRQAADNLEQIDPAKVLYMRYEDFVVDPVNQFGRILAHFDLDYPEALRQEVGQRVDPGRRQKWKRLDPQILAGVLPYLEQEMARHGYTVPDEVRGSDDQPAAPADLTEGGTS